MIISEALMDGFTTLAVSELKEGSVLNVEPYRNEYSPFSRVQVKDPAPASNEVLVDTYYGVAYDPWIRVGGAAYGITDALPKSPLDDIARGFLRVPFAKIPCIDVEDAAGLSTTIARVRDAHPDLTLLFRGQTSNFSLSKKTCWESCPAADRHANRPFFCSAAGVWRETGRHEALSRPSTSIQVETMVRSPPTQRLFPGPDEDLFGISLAAAKDHLAASLPGLLHFVRDFVWVRN
jgi:hypothetical protein